MESYIVLTGGVSIISFSLYFRFPSLILTSSILSPSQIQVERVESYSVLTGRVYPVERFHYLRMFSSNPFFHDIFLPHPPFIHFNPPQMQVEKVESCIAKVEYTI